MLNKYTELGAVDLHTYSGGWSVRHCILTLKIYIEGDGPEQIRLAVNTTEECTYNAKSRRVHVNIISVEKQ